MGEWKEMSERDNAKRSKCGGWFCESGLGVGDVGYFVDGMFRHLWLGGWRSGFCKLP